MASHLFFNRPNGNQVRSSHSGDYIRCRSTTLLCLHKILRIISTYPSFENLKSTSTSSRFDLVEPTRSCLRGEDDRRLFDVDLNLSLGSPSHPQQEQPENGGERAYTADVVDEVPEIIVPVLPSSASITEKSSTGGRAVSESDDLFRNKTLEIEDEIVEEKEIEVQPSKINCNGAATNTPDEEVRKVETEQSERQAKEHRSEEGLDLLIEAVKFVSGEFEDGCPNVERTSLSHEISGEFSREETRNRSVGSVSKRRRQNDSGLADLNGDFEDVSPVVRSKRGRSQVLPYKFRDSVLEPLKPLSRHRSPAAATKRRSR